MLKAMELKVQCWTEELAGHCENTLSVDEEQAFWVKWMDSANENNDIRLLIGAFEQEHMLGAAFASFAETSDIPSRGIELNGLWVHPDHRGRGISLRLVVHVLQFYLALGMERIVVYNHHYAPSNAFYRKFGAQLARQEHQMDGKLLVDVFMADIRDIKERMEQSLSRLNGFWEQVEKRE